VELDEKDVFSQPDVLALGEVGDFAAEYFLPKRRYE
jgi:hypothetical protein